MSPHIHALIPAHDCGRTIAAVVEGIRQQGIEVTVVDEQAVADEGIDHAAMSTDRLEHRLEILVERRHQFDQAEIGQEMKSFIYSRKKVELPPSKLPAAANK